MDIITKETILSLILEQMDLNEMPQPSVEWTLAEPVNPPKVFTSENMKTASEFQVYLQELGIDGGRLKSQYGQPGGKSTTRMVSLNPELRNRDLTTRQIDTTFKTAIKEDLIFDKAICTRYRVSRTNPKYAIYHFDNYDSLPTKKEMEIDGDIYQKLENYILVETDNPDIGLALIKYHGNLRHKLLDNPVKKSENPMSDRTYAKRYLHYSMINQVFGRQEIISKLFLSMIPPITAAKEYDKPVTDKIQDSSYVKTFDILLHGIWAGTSVDKIVDEVLNYRDAIDFGDETSKVPAIKHMSRYHKKAYPNGKWDVSQKTGTNFKPTEKLRLAMKGMKKKGIVIESKLHIIGGVQQGEFDEQTTNRIFGMTATFDVESKIRKPGEDIASTVINPIDTITINVTKSIPQDIEISYDDENRPYIEYSRDNAASTTTLIREAYIELMTNLGNAIMNIDSEQAIEQYLMLEPETYGLEEEKKKPKKIVINEEQLKQLFKKKKLRITESQLRGLLKK